MNAVVANLLKNLNKELIDEIDQAAYYQRKILESEKNVLELKEAILELERINNE